jgi:hypothetical protein
MRALALRTGRGTREDAIAAPHRLSGVAGIPRGEQANTGQVDV